MKTKETKFYYQSAKAQMSCTFIQDFRYNVELWSCELKRKRRVNAVYGFNTKEEFNTFLQKHELAEK